MNGEANPVTRRTLLHTTPQQDARVRDILVLTTTRADGSSGPGFLIDWRMLGGFSLGEMNVPAWTSPRVEVFGDEWRAFSELRDVFDLLATFDSRTRGSRATADEVKASLLAIGFVESEFSE